MNKKNGFSLVEMIITLNVFVIVVGTMLYFVNPLRQFAMARDAKREADVEAIMNAIGQNAADNRGVFTCTSGSIPASSTRMTSSGGYNLAPCIVPNYLISMPYDPSAVGASFASTTSYNTAYAIFKSSTTSRITVHAIYPEISEYIYSIR